MSSACERPCGVIPGENPCTGFRGPGHAILAQEFRSIFDSLSSSLYLPSDGTQNTQAIGWRQDRDHISAHPRSSQGRAPATQGADGSRRQNLAASHA